MDKVNLEEKFGLFNEYWVPQIAGEINDSLIKLAKFKGEFPWHQHEHEDELFLVVKGSILIKLKDQDIHLQAGEFFIVPKGVEHCPVAEEEAHILLIEPKTTINTGNTTNTYTKTDLDHI